MNFFQTIKNIEKLMQDEKDPAKREQYRQIIKQTINKLEE